MAYLAGGVKYYSKRSLFCRKAPQKTFDTFTRELDRSPGEQKSFAELAPR
jgi:hypothetical protein